MKREGRMEISEGQERWEREEVGEEKKEGSKEQYKVVPLRKCHTLKIPVQSVHGFLEPIVSPDTAIGYQVSIYINPG